MAIKLLTKPSSGKIFINMENVHYKMLKEKTISVL